jgi:hypothetical protein
MQDRKVTLLIDESGAVQIDVEGVKGKACTELTAEMEQALGMVASQTKKAEYHTISSKEAAHQQLRG